MTYSVCIESVCGTVLTRGDDEGTDTLIVRGVCLYNSQLFWKPIKTLILDWILLYSRLYIFNLLALFIYLIQVLIFVLVSVNLVFECLVQFYMESVSWNSLRPSS